MAHKHSKLVYSTDRNIPEKKKSDTHDQVSATKPAYQKVIVRLDRKGRGGKSVTVVESIVMNQISKTDFLKQLKSKLGTGGTIKDDSFEFQGDHCNRLIAELEKMGYKPRRSGG